MSGRAESPTVGGACRASRAALGWERYLYDCYHVVPTGSFADRTNELGTYDINGNVWEVVPSTTDGRGYEIRGGAFNCASAAARLECTFNAGWDRLYAGFRCCLDR